MLMIQQYFGFLKEGLKVHTTTLKWVTDLLWPFAETVTI
jgi:hypothetical protein